MRVRPERRAIRGRPRQRGRAGARPRTARGGCPRRGRGSAGAAAGADGVAVQELALIAVVSASRSSRSRSSRCGSVPVATSTLRKCARRACWRTRPPWPRSRPSMCAGRADPRPAAAPRGAGRRGEAADGMEEVTLMNKLAKLSAPERKQIIGDFAAEVFHGLDPTRAWRPTCAKLPCAGPARRDRQQRCQPSSVSWPAAHRIPQRAAG
jgi:hypothetical protein